MDTRGKMSIKIDALKRYVMINSLASVLPLYIVTEFPKSGGSWIAQMLAEGLDIPFPRNQAPKLESCVMHGHNLYSPFMKNVVCVHRDGRDIVTSAYFHMLFENDKNSPLLVKTTRVGVDFDDYDNVQENLPAFIHYLVKSREKAKSPGKFTWGQFVESWRSKNAIFVRYEDMIDDCVGELDRIFKALGKTIQAQELDSIASKYSFKNQTNRQAGEENTRSFLRKGQPGDWKEKFTPESARVFDSYFGKHLIELGYEKDRSWVNNL